MGLVAERLAKATLALAWICLRWREAQGVPAFYGGVATRRVVLVGLGAPRLSDEDEAVTAVVLPIQIRISRRSAGDKDTVNC